MNFRDAVTDAMAVAVPLAVVYFAGWAYLSSYLGQFGIDATQVEIPWPTVLVYAFRALSSYLMWTVFLLLAIALFIALALWVRQRAVIISGRAFRLSHAYALLMVFAVPGYLWGVHKVSAWAAEDKATSVWFGERPKAFAVSDDERDVDVLQFYQACGLDGRFEQIIAFPDRTFLLCRHPAAPCSEGVVFTVAASGEILLHQRIRRAPQDKEPRCEPLLTGN